MKSQILYRVPVRTGLLFQQTFKFMWHSLMNVTSYSFCVLLWDTHKAETAYWEGETTKTLGFIMPAILF